MERTKLKIMCNNCDNDYVIIPPTFDYYRLHCPKCDPEKHHCVMISNKFKTVVTVSKQDEITVHI